MNEHHSLWRPALGLAVLASLLAGAPQAHATPKKRKKGRPVWPVPNPGFKVPGFQPTSSKRLISGVFGPRLKWGGARYDHHEGFDFYAHYDKTKYPRGGHPVLAVLPGVVSEVINPPSPERTETGRKVVITHDLPWTALKAPKSWGQVRTGYLHLKRISVRKGQRIKAGEVLGQAGSTGYTSTVHLHFNVYRAGGRDVNVNPARLFTPKLFPGSVVPVHKRTVEVVWLERDKEAGTVLVRVYLAHNAYSLDGFVFQIGRDKSRALSFEHVSATQRKLRDTGDRGLFPKLRFFPLRYNGGGAIERVNGNKIPRGWPLAKHRVPNGKGVRLGFDLLATEVPKSVKSKKIKLTIYGVNRDKVTASCRGFAKR